jgi:hypothetical protein
MESENATNKKNPKTMLLTMATGRFMAKRQLALRLRSD